MAKPKIGLTFASDFEKNNFTNIFKLNFLFMAKIILKKSGKNLLIILSAIILVGGLYFWAQSQPEQPKSDAQKSFFDKLFGGDDKESDDNIIKIGTNTFAGFNYLMWLNHGLEPNKDCPLFKMTGLMAKIIVQDDFPAGRAAFINDDINLLYCTVDAFPTEMSEGSEMANAGAKYIYLSNWSRGADAIVAAKRIRNVGDLIGKVVACSQGTASHTLLLNTLEANGIGSDRVHLGEGIDKNKVNIKVVENGLEAASTFKSGQCDAAVVYSPDDADIVSTMDAWVLVSTKQASNIICDGLIAKQSYIEKNREKLEKLIAAFLTANVKMNTDEAAVKEASRYFAKYYGTDEDFANIGTKTVYFATLGDEANFFGLNAEYSGIKGFDLYDKMSGIYSSLKLCKSPLRWDKVSDSSIIEALLNNPSMVQGDQKAEGKRTFTPATDAVKDAEAISAKKVTIEFQSGSCTLDNDAMTMIDREFIPIVKRFSNSRIRIEGNCDATGSDEFNKKLSLLRAQAVRDYICRKLNIDQNQFVAVGNGSSKAKRDGVQGDNQLYRTTDLELIRE